MFENLWIQAELEWQSKVKHAYFHIFKGQKLRNEVYKRDWASGGGRTKQIDFFSSCGNNNL